MNKGKRDKGKNKAPKYREHTSGCQSGGGGGRWGKQMKGIKSTLILMSTLESLYYTPETNITLYINVTSIITTAK